MILFSCYCILIIWGSQLVALVSFIKSKCTYYHNSDILQLKKLLSYIKILTIHIYIVCEHVDNFAIYYVQISCGTLFINIRAMTKKLGMGKYKNYNIFYKYCIIVIWSGRSGSLGVKYI